MTHPHPDFETAFEAAPTPLMLINLKVGFVLEANPAALQLLGFSRAQMMGKTPQDLGIWTDPLLHSRLMQQFVNTGRVDKERVKVQHRLGHALDVELSFTGLLHGGQRCILVTLYDMQAHQVLEEQLRSMRALLRVAMRNETATTWRYERRLRQFVFSPKTSELLGYTDMPNGSAPLPCDALVYHADAALWQSTLDACTADNPLLDLDIRLHLSRGKFRWYRLVGHYQNADGLQGTLEDVHDDKVREIERERNAHRAALAISAADMGTWEMFENGYVIWDAQTYRLYGYDPATPKAPAEIFREALSDAEYARCSRWLGKCLKHSLSLSIEFELSWPNGQRRWLATNGQGMTTHMGERKVLMGIGWDITDRRRAQDAMRRHQEDLSYLTGQLLEQEKQTTRKLALALHDQLGQTLTAARLMLDFQMQSQPSEALKRMETLMTQAMDEVRGLLMDLRPPLLDEQGLGAALDNEIQRTRPLGTTTDIIFRCREQCRHKRWPTDVEYAFFMIAREAIANALAHAKADLIQVHLSGEGEGLTLEIMDDGLGLHSGTLSRSPGHLGVVGMQERASAVNARLSVSSVLGDGVRIQLMWTPAP